MRADMTRRWLILWLVASLVGVQFASCNAPDAQAACESKLSLSLQEYIGQLVPNPSQFEERAAARYGAKIFGYTPPLDPGADVFPSFVELHWSPTDYQRRYGMLLEGGRAVRNWVMYESVHRPTLGDVTGCLGPPQQYWAWYGETFRGTGWATDVLLLYPAQGILVSGFDQSRQRAIETGKSEDSSFLKEVRVSAVSYARPMSSEELIRRAYSFAEFGTRDALVHWYLDNIEPWPATWDEVEIMTLPRP